MSEDDFKNYYKPMPWFSLPYGDERIAAYNEKFNPKGTIPKLIVLNKKGEECIKNGRDLVVSEGEDAFNNWKNKAADV